MIRYFVFDGHISSDYGIYIDGSPCKSPSREVENITIPGRNGTLTVDMGRLNQVNMDYVCCVSGDAIGTLKEWQAILLENSKWRKFVDSADPKYYRLARCIDATDFDVISCSHNMGVFALPFEFQPERYDINGERAITVSQGEHITLSNPYRFPSKPLIRVFGTGSFRVGSNTITVKNTRAEGIEIDCDAKTIRSGTEAMGQNVELTNHAYPVLIGSGDTVIDIVNGISKLAIYPRWWTV